METSNNGHLLILFDIYGIKFNDNVENKETEARLNSTEELSITIDEITQFYSFLHRLKAEIVSFQTMQLIVNSVSLKQNYKDIKW